MFNRGPGFAIFTKGRQRFQERVHHKSTLHGKQCLLALKFFILSLSVLTALPVSQCLLLEPNQKNGICCLLWSLWKKKKSTKWRNEKNKMYISFYLKYKMKGGMKNKLLPKSLVLLFTTNPVTEEKSLLHQPILGSLSNIYS